MIFFQKYICKVTDTSDIWRWSQGYKLIKRYAPKSEWKDIPYFDEKFININILYFIGSY